MLALKELIERLKKSHQMPVSGGDSTRCGTFCKER